VNHLSKYLWTRLCVEPPSLTTATTTATSSVANTSVATNLPICTENDFQIFICLNDKLPNSYQHLNQNLTLEQIMERHWKINRPVELFYHLKSNTAINNNNNSEQLNGICNNSNSSSMSSSNSSSSSSGSY
jgi:ADP-ribosylglycohydrolase